jgi:hypothetical protein
MRNIVYSRGIMYSDQSGIETGVSYDPTYNLLDQSYVNITGVGEDLSVRIDHIPLLIEWLQDIYNIHNDMKVK